MPRFPRVHGPVGPAALAGLLLLGPLAAAQSPPPAMDAYREPASRLIGAAYADDAGWQRVAELTDSFGHRLSGSAASAAAVEWAVERMRADGLQNVRAEPVMVPVWVRGRESAHVLDPVERPLAMLGLGGSVGTPPGGLVAEALVVTSFDDLDARAAEARGRIVVYSVPWEGYGKTVQYRAQGASRAARHGAVAVLVRSAGPTGLRTPHTGGVGYAADQPKIPAAAIAAEDAAMLQRLQERGQRVRLRLAMEAHVEPDVESANVIGEIVGREAPDEVVVLGGHFDSWDVGTGASDDALGCIVTWEAARLMTQLGLRPRRTVRVVLFANEENGLRGGLAYRDRYLGELARHVLMLEVDLGVFGVRGFGFTGGARARAIVQEAGRLLAGIGAQEIGDGGGGADIGPAVQAGNVPAMSPLVDAERYFVVHHTPADTVDRIQPQEVSKAVASVAVMAYVIADLPERLPAEAKGAGPGSR